MVMDITKGFFRDQAVDLKDEIWNIALTIGENPELGYEEHYAVGLLSEFLARHGFEVKQGIGGLETAFLARFKGSCAGPRLAFLAEYDALPEIGHGCGHNLIGTASAAAAVVLSKSSFLPGEVIVIGTPAEETSGAKVTLVEKGIFQDVDVAMMFHPGSQNVAQISTLALDAWEFVFSGRAAHAVAASYYGINALDALIEFFVRVKELKQNLTGNNKINGIITEGGTIPNIIPERAVARFYIRADNRRTLDRLSKDVIQCAEDGAQRIGAQVCWHKFEFSYDEMCSNSVLAECFAENLQELGVKNICMAQTALGSVDMGNVSRVVPAIHPYLTLGKGTDVPHTKGFAQSATSENGKEILALAVPALALTGWDVLSDPDLFVKIRQEFEREIDDNKQENNDDA